MLSGDVRVEVQRAVPLAPHTTLGIGGPARWFMRAESVDDIVAAHRWSLDRGIDMFVLGGGSNLVAADPGIDGLVVFLGLSGIAIEMDGADTLLTASAGEPWDSVVRASIARGLAGLECLSGIPGTAGATPIQNVGAYGQEVAETIDRITVYDRVALRPRILVREECGFAYRMSRFKRDDKDRFIVCDVTFRLRAGPPAAKYPDIINYLDRAGITSPSIEDVRQAVLAVRRRKGMVLDSTDPDTRSVGSFFMNPLVSADVRERAASVAGLPAPGFALSDGRVKIPAAWLIEHAGFQRGDADGAVGISTKHTLALVNRGGATARDVLRLATRIKRQVSDRFGVLLRPEPVFVGFDNDPDVEYLLS